MLRRQLLDGDWTAGQGLALDELDPGQHLIPPRPVPAHWMRWGGFDWGFAHPWVFVACAADEDGNVYVTHVIRGRRDLPKQIAARIWEVLIEDGRRIALKSVAAGHDCWHDVRARGDQGPNIAERLYAAGLPMHRANISRVSGLQNLRSYLRWRGRNRPPALRLFDTAGCRWLLEQLQGLVTDPDQPEDALKQDADRDTGEGGDDGYDALRYALMVRPYTRAARPTSEAFDPWRSEGRDPQTADLAWDRERERELQRQIRQAARGEPVQREESGYGDHGGGGQWIP